MNATIDVPVHRAGRLPEDLTSFVGRRRMTADVKRLLADSRLLTLVGPAGVGKTRLAVRAARELGRAFSDGVRLVELAELDDTSLVASAVAAVLGLPDASEREPTTVLIDHLADKQMLLVLDNCEHLLDACARLVKELLSASAGLRVLATSREPLAVGGEHVLPVGPLAVPPGDTPATDDLDDLDDLAGRYPAMRLFQDRAAAVLPGFALTGENVTAVVHLCRRLDGLPLAIELAAAWLRVLAPEQLVERLEDRFRLLRAAGSTAPPRHQTLRAAVEWSFGLCSGPQRALWARLSVFAGDFDLDAAEAVCADDEPAAADVFTVVAGLVDKSILVRGEGEGRARYRMLETVRQYGAERLAADGQEERLRRGHRDYFLGQAEQADAQSCGPLQGEWFRRLTAERANLWAALEYCVTAPGEARAGLRMAAALWPYWVACGFVRDGAYWLGRALAADTEPSGDRARALWISGWIAFLKGDNAAGLVLLREARALAERLDDRTQLTYALQYLAEAEMFVGHLAVAVPMLDDALAGHRASRRWTAPALLIFGQVARAAMLSGDVERAAGLLTECISICDGLGERWTRSWSEWNLGVARWTTGALRAAAVHLRSALGAKHGLDDRLGIPFCVELLGWVAVSAGDAHRAAVLFGAADAGWEAIGRPLFGFETLLAWRRDNRARCRESLGDRAFAGAFAAGSRMPCGELVAYALEGERRAAEPRAEADAPGPPWPRPLTRREREVAAMVAQGMTNKEIAAHLVIAQRTAEGHIEKILSKLGFTSRTQIAVWATRRTGG